MNESELSQLECKVLEAMHRIPSDNKALHKLVRETLFGPERPGAPEMPKPEGVLSSNPEDWVVDRVTGEYWHKTWGKMMSGKITDRSFLESRELAHEWIKRDQLAKDYIQMFRMTVKVRDALRREGFL